MRNRIIENDTLLARRPRVAIWHADDAGDWHELQYKLPKGISAAAQEKALLYMGRRWIDWKARQGWECDPRSIRPAGPFPCAELDEQDMETFVIQARFRRTRPLLMTLDEASAVFESQPQAPQDGAILTQLAQRPDLIEANARGKREARQRARESEQAQAETEAWRRQHGLPEFAERDPDNWGPEWTLRTPATQGGNQQQDK